MERCSWNTRLFIVFILSLFQHCLVGGERPQGCPLSKLQIITFNETILPQTLESISAQIRYTDGPLLPTSLVNYGPNHTNVYCAPDIDPLPQPIINLTFTQPVVVVGIISGGYTYQVADPVLDGLEEYVSKFTLETSQTENPEEDDYVLYNANQTEGTSEFVIGDDNVDRFILLNEPFMARTVRLQIIEKVQTALVVNFTCWSLAFFGCLSSEAILDSNDSPVTTSAVVTPSVTPVNGAGEMQTQVNVVSTKQILSIVLPVAILTVFSVTVIVVVGVLICIKNRRSQKVVEIPENETQETRERAVTLNLVQNELYDSQSYHKRPDSIQNPEGYEPVFDLYNPVVESPSPNQTESPARNSLVDNQIYSLPQTMTEQIPISRNKSYGMGNTRYALVPARPQPAADTSDSERQSKIYENIAAQPS